MCAKEKINRITVKIFNDEYTIKGNAEVRHIQKVAGYVHEQMKNLSLKNPYLPPTKVAVLTSVNMADDLLRLKEDYEALVKLLDEENKG